MKEEKFYVNGDEVTKEEFEKLRDNDEITQCDDCEEWFYTDDMIYVEDIGKYICEDCIENGDYWYCDGCGNYFSYNCRNYYMQDTERNYCNNCLNNMDYMCCYECGDYYEHSANGSFDDWDDWYCDRCIENGYGNYRRNDGAINGYHCNPEFKLLGDDTELHFGFEFEVNTNYMEWDELCDYANKVRNIMGDVCNDIEEDGSVDGGFEIQTNPMTWKYYQEIGKEKIKDVMDYLKENGFANYDDQCGVHIHFTKEPIKNKAPKYVEEMYLLLNVFQDDVISYAGRENIYSCSEPYFKNSVIDGIVRKYQITNFIHNRYNNGGRYQPINDCPSKTVEWRIFKGTTDFETIDNYIKMSYNMVQAVMNHNYLGKSFSEITGLSSNSEIKFVLNYRKEREVREIMNNLNKFYVELAPIVEAYITNRYNERCGNLGNNSGSAIRYLIMSNSYIEFRDNTIKPLIELSKTATSVKEINDFISNRMTYSRPYIELKDKYLSLEEEIHNKYNMDKPIKNPHQHTHSVGKEGWEKYLQIKNDFKVGDKVLINTLTFVGDTRGTILDISPKEIILDISDNSREFVYKFPTYLITNVIKREEN